MNCRNMGVGCYHLRAVHMDGRGRCTIRGCMCAGFVP